MAWLVKGGVERAGEGNGTNHCKVRTDDRDIPWMLTS